ncbi:usherin-like [Lineus longissimus]|uniref:usherin-like n=1 Tax=Lineus longissimus TaxID=88925 RepID=UPI00315DE045
MCVIMVGHTLSSASRTGKHHLSYLYIILSWSVFFGAVIIRTTSGQLVPASSVKRNFPVPFNVAKLKPLTTTPGQSTCGIPSRSTFCQSTTSESSITQCTLTNCIQECPQRTTLPSQQELLKEVTSDCISKESVNIRPGSLIGSYSLAFTGKTGCFLTPPQNVILGSNGALTFTAWIWRAEKNNGTLIEKASLAGETIFKLIVSRDVVIFTFKSTANKVETVFFHTIIQPKTWTHLAVQMYQGDISFYVNGLKPGFSAAYSKYVRFSVKDSSSGVQVRIGSSVDGSQPFEGNLQNFHFFSSVLTNREIQEVYDGKFPSVPIQSECRCPSSHLKVQPVNSRFCIRNGVASNTDDEVIRMNGDSHLLAYLNDDDSNTIWVSSANLDKVAFTVSLQDLFQVFFVVLDFYSPFPDAVIIERKKNSTAAWQQWQLYATDCKARFKLDNNGPLKTTDSVNCIQIGGTYIPGNFSKGSIMFTVLSEEVGMSRPGYDDFYNTPVLQEFVEAEEIRVTLMGHFSVIQNPQFDPKHKYYGLSEFTVSARCQCNGHAVKCNTDSMPYTCECLAESYTNGNKCEKCLPLYNDKPFRKGDQTNAYNCKRCDCYNHADSCVYNATYDSAPNDHSKGGGGVCVNCKHNTVGQKCDRCKALYYRKVGGNLNDIDVCSPCNCYINGVKNKAMDCDKIGGQCTCRDNVDGRQCNQCEKGFFNLQASNALGCDACNCNTNGTNNGDITCQQLTGECTCKKHVEGDKCDKCQRKYFNLSIDNKDGCSSCDCNPNGITNAGDCDPKTGACACKPNIASRQCDQCADKYHDFSKGCIPCGCNLQGSASTTCDKNTGQCVCKPNVQGLKCDQCKDNYYNLGVSATLGCDSCGCDQRGTINGTRICNRSSGQCPCKGNVFDMKCDKCKAQMWNLNETNPEGCQNCDCDVQGTVQGKLNCDQNTGQCTCLSQRTGRRCEKCIDGYHVKNATAGGCTECKCSNGALDGTVCDPITGQCQCKGSSTGTTGLKCDKCLPKFYGFELKTGLCSACACNEAGSVNGTCDGATGQCYCKLFVQGKRCDTCEPGASILDTNNIYGCSKTPAQQPAPQYTVVNATALRLTWSPPDYPNGIILQYFLFRDGQQIFASFSNSSQGIKAAREMTDKGLTAYTEYKYFVQVWNIHGNATSQTTIARTPPGVPEGNLTLSVSTMRKRSATLSWAPPKKSNGPIKEYILSSTTASDSKPTEHWKGSETTTTVQFLVPFTNYTFSLKACTTGGCLTSEAVTGQTKMDAPEKQAVPKITALSEVSLYVGWEPPALPNGIIIMYELWMRGLKDQTGKYDPPEKRIFNPTGQYNPRSTAAPEKNALAPPATNFTVDNLRAFTVYQFQVTAKNEVGQTVSDWTNGTTKEAVPLSMPTPVILGVNSATLNVTWKAASQDEARGVIAQYRVWQYKATNRTLFPFIPIIEENVYTAQGNETFYVVNGFLPYTDHKFKIEACNTAGCVNSTDAIGKTLAAAPSEMQPPTVEGFNSTVMEIKWQPPLKANGPPPHYLVERTTVALNSPPPKVIRGTRFTGAGFYKFPAKTIPYDVGFTGIDFWFKTRQKDGLILFSASEGRQEEMIAVQMRGGRPFFIFNPQGCATAVEPDPSKDGNRSYGDNTWHRFVARRTEKSGEVTVDDTYRGTKNSTCAKGSMIGISTGIYLGGVPNDFEIHQAQQNSRLQVLNTAFQGCLRDVKFLQQVSPADVWKDLDFATAEVNEQVLPSWEGCPIDLPKGDHFLGKGYAGFNSTVLQSEETYAIQMTIRTEFKTGLLLFAHGAVGHYTYAQLKDGNIEYGVHTPTLKRTVTYPSSIVSICDGGWRTIKLDKQQEKLSIQVDNEKVVSEGDLTGSLKAFHTGIVYVGGIMADSQASKFIKDSDISKLIVPEGFGGCMKDKIVFRDTADNPFNISKQYVHLLNVHLDGCPPNITSTAPCQAKSTVQITNTTANMTYDEGLGVFSDYIYRVVAANSQGSTASTWVSGRTKEGPPTGIVKPQSATALTGYIIKVAWTSPTGNTGLLTKYILKAYVTDKPEVAPVMAPYPPSINTDSYEGNITTAVPYTNYTVKLEACTSGGCTESKDGIIVITKEEAPENVSSPTAVMVGATFIEVSWTEPSKPNGKITGYFLNMDGQSIYSGALLSKNATNLRVYTTYRFQVKACTVIGCTDGLSVQLTTAEKAPSSVDPPTLRVQGKREIRVEWKRPLELNGKFQRYILYVSTNSSSLGPVQYNSSEEFFDYVLKNLLAGTTYYISLSACTGGGCTTSSPSNATTEEDSPEGVPAPVVVSPSPYELIITWGIPQYPNGEITQYEVWHNNVKVYNISGRGDRKHQIGGLLPYTLHIFFIRACTRLGCGTSNETKIRTQEAKPEGTIGLTLKVNDARSVIVSWTQPAKPYGVMKYDVYFSGLFYVDPAKWNYLTTQATRSLLNTLEFGKDFTIDGLIPSSTYDVTVNGSNSKGYIMSNNKKASMPEGSPDGVKPPTLISPTSTSLRITWEQVGRANSNRQPLFQVDFREKVSGAKSEMLFQQPTTSTSFLKTDLQAYKEYEVRLNASNSLGFTLAGWVSGVTLQDKPGSFDPPMVRNVAQRQLDLTWEHPLKPNGVILHYKIYVNDKVNEQVPGNTTVKTIAGLTPYTEYKFIIEGCTSAGCTKTLESQPARTLTAAPEGIAPPTMDSQTPTSVLVMFTKPSLPNGVISKYSIERQLNGTTSVIIVKEFRPNDDLKMVDANNLAPYTVYQYRVTATTGAGVGRSNWADVRTKPSKPGGMNPPYVVVLGADTLNISWQFPITPNGAIQSYIIKLPEPRLEVRDPAQTNLVVSKLTPYTSYSVTVTACTFEGGCSESAPTVVRTQATKPSGMKPPVAQSISQNLISILWQPPTNPNGPNIKYELARMKLKQPLDSSAGGFDSWQSVYQGTGTYYENKPLTILTTYKYRVTVFNGFDSLITEASAEVTTFGGMPTVAPVVKAIAIDHISVGLNWTTPSVVELQGYVEKFSVAITSTKDQSTKTYPAGTSTAIVSNLLPNTEYTFVMTTIVTGGGSIKSVAVKADTKDGTPVGLNAPTLTVVSDNSLRVTWTAPSNPNGEITAYNIYVDGENITTGMTVPGSYAVTGLKPYVIYSVQVEVCTVYSCSKSNATEGVTKEAIPQLIYSPTPEVLSSTAIKVVWRKPGKPNGIILKYEIWRKTTVPCSTTPAPDQNTTQGISKCTYIECGAKEALCGTTCFSGSKVCCSGSIYDLKPGYDCCGTSYTNKRQATTDVCCGGKFYTKQTDYQCCGKSYVKVAQGQICCPDSTQDRVDVGFGDSCCGSIPYVNSGAQVCCFGQLHDRYGKQCCGNALVKDSLVCCGNYTEGKAYVQNTDLTCCGTQFVDSNTTTCCTSNTKVSKVHTYSSADALRNSNEKCCGTERISNGLSCCNNAGYNPTQQTCADKSDAESGCGYSVVCPVAQKENAFCDRCNFDKTQKSCQSVPGFYNPIVTPTSAPTTSPTECTLGPTKVTIADPEVLSYTDKDLYPYTRYEYAVVIVNGAGNGLSDYTPVTTAEDKPVGVSPPKATVKPGRYDTIILTWDPPTRANGIISNYLLFRDGIGEIYRGITMSYSDNNLIYPYKTYTYYIRACTGAAGCTDSDKVTVATLQGQPEGVHEPVLNVVNSSTIHLKWTEPGNPNGLILSYVVYQLGSGQVVNATAAIFEHDLTGLIPNTEYQFILQACSVAGCTNSSVSKAKTKQDKPEGLSAPTILVINAFQVEVYWKLPLKINGILIYFKLYRRQGNTITQVQQFSTDVTKAKDNGLQPGTTYFYFIEAATIAGGTNSSESPIIMPTQTPEGIKAPSNVTALDSNRILVEWQPATKPTTGIDQYRIVLNAGQVDEVVSVAYDAATRSAIIQNLKPFVTYDVRMRACLANLKNGCGNGPGKSVTTHEAPPSGQKAPTLFPKSSTIIDVSWEKPTDANGKILKYLIYKRVFGTNGELLIYFSDGETFTLTNADPGMKPFTFYEYKVVAENSKGRTTSPWARVQTPQAVPQGIAPPQINKTSPYGFKVQWKVPENPNGIITIYRLSYTVISNDPTDRPPVFNITVPGDVLLTSFSGLSPYTKYRLRVIAMNNAGEGVSVWVSGTTGEAAPAGLEAFKVTPLEGGNAVNLKWNAPSQPNGVITTYRIYDGDKQAPIYSGSFPEFEYGGTLTPFTSYTVQLEACTTGGCARGQKQTIQTAEVMPKDQTPPTFGKVNSTHVVIRWTAPIRANGKINIYRVYRTESAISSKSKRATGTIIYSTDKTDANSYEYADGTVKPYRRYDYNVEACNSKGCITSPSNGVETAQAPPSGLVKPSVQYHGTVAGSLNISWSLPSDVNGILQGYQLRRNASVPLSFTPTDAKWYIDNGLTAYTWYSYTVTACTGGGCSTSAPGMLRTRETPPLEVDAPKLTAAGATAIGANWVMPQITNGVINRYILYMDDLVKYEGMTLEYKLTGLIPYQAYTFILAACTSGGCKNSSAIAGRPGEAAPLDIPAPTLQVTSAKSIEVTWVPPLKPNGIITSYEIRRDGTLVNTTVGNQHTDYDLVPGTRYSYTVTAFNSKGKTTSPATTATTYSSSPLGILPPQLEVLSNTAIRAKWTAPATPNGQIVNYTLYKDTENVFSAVSAFDYIVRGLSYYTKYSFRIQACTSAGCATSDIATATTNEAAPSNVGPPTLTARHDNTGSHRDIQITWVTPSQPNGIISRYELSRRMVIKKTPSYTYGPIILVFKGLPTPLEYTDNDPKLKPYQEYEYRLSVYNKVGYANSTWAGVKTYESPPTSLKPPVVIAKTATIISVEITPPSEPNGVISRYSVVVNGEVRNQSLSPSLTASGLEPWTTYSIQADACTPPGCTRSNATSVQTAAAKPVGLAAAVVLQRTATSVMLKWQAPAKPNGIISSYELLKRTACPPTEQPFTEVCNVGSSVSVFQGLTLQHNVTGLKPYIAYGFLIQAYNQIGPVDFPVWTNTATLSKAPTYLTAPTMTPQGSLIIVDWSNSFGLNGKLREFIMYTDQKRTYSGLAGNASMERASKDQTYQFQVKCITEMGEVTSSSVTFDPSMPDNIGTTDMPPPTAAPQVTQFYQEVWFIALVLVVSLLLLFLGIVLCLRYSGRNTPYIRERAPLQHRHKRMPFGMNYCIDPYDGSIIAADPNRPNSQASLISVKNQQQPGFVNPAFQRSNLTIHQDPDGSIVDLSFDKLSHKSSKYLSDDDEEEEQPAWDAHLPPMDSGLGGLTYDEDFADNKPYSSMAVQKEQMTFTDTHL